MGTNCDGVRQKQTITYANQKNVNEVSEEKPVQETASSGSTQAPAASPNNSNAAASGTTATITTVDGSTNTSKTDNAPEIGEQLSGAIDGENYVAPTDGEHEITEAERKRQQAERLQQQIDKAINDAIKGSGLSLEEAKKILYSINSGNKNINLSTLKKVLNCLKYALEDCTINGKLDKTKLGKIFGCYVFMTIKSDKKNVDCDQARAVMKMSLIQFVVANNPELKNKKNIDAKDIKNSLKVFVKANFTQEKIEEFKKAPQEAKNVIKSMFGMLLANCNQDELNMLFEAFVLLLQDEDMANYVPVLITEVCDHLKQDKTGKLQKFINEDLDKILTKLGFKPETINKLKELGIIQSINEDNIDELLTGGLAFLQSIEPNDLSVLLEALNLIMKDSPLTQEQIQILDKYKPQLDSLINVFAAIAKNPELIKGHEELFEKINALLKSSGLSNYVCWSIESLYEQFPDLFKNCDSKDDLTKILNELTDNKYSDPDKSYTQVNSDSGNPDSICYSKDYGIDYAAMAASIDDKIQNLYNQQNENEFSLVIDNKKDKNEDVISPFQKYSSVKKLTASEIFEGIAKKYLKIGDVIDKYNELSQSGKDFINKMVEIMSPGQQNYFLNGIKNSIVLAIVRHTNIDPSKLKLNLDHDAQKEIERIMEEKEKTKENLT